MPSNFSYEEYVHLGKQSYREQRFDAALAHYQNALQLAKQPDIDLLDSLAAISSKLANFEAALKYGKRMIQAESTNARGYLRVGRILQLKSSSKEKELAIYERGLQKSLVTDPQRKSLQYIRDRLYRQLNPPATYDPLTVLPAEIIHMIYGYVEFHDLVRSLRVSKGWRSYLISQPWHWQHIDLSQAKVSAQKRLPAKALQSWAKWSRFSIKTANLGAFSHRQSVVALTIKCQSLGAMIFGRESSVDHEVIMAVLKHAKQLKSLVCMQNITCEHGPSTILRAAQSLEELHLKYKTHAVVGVEQAVVELPSLVTLQRLSISGLEDRILSIPLDGFHRVSTYLYALSTRLNEKQILSAVPNLTDLRLSRVSIDNVASSAGSAQLDSLRMLQKLSLNNVHFEQWIRWPSTLETFICDHVRTLFGFLHPTQAVCFPSLCHIEMTRNYETLETLKNLLYMPSDQTPEEEPNDVWPAIKQLETLKVGALQWDSQPVMEALFKVDLAPVFRHPRTSDLKVISVDAIDFDDDLVDIINAHLSKVEVIRLTNASITGVGIKRLVQKQTNLVVMVLENCTGISVDALQWARLQGVKVVNNIKLIPQVASGRSIRWL